MLLALRVDGHSMCLPSEGIFLVSQKLLLIEVVVNDSVYFCRHGVPNSMCFFKQNPFNLGKSVLVWPLFSCKKKWRSETH